MPQNAVRRERPDLYKSFNPAERLDNNRSLGFARDLALRQAQGRLCGLPLGSRRSPHSRPQTGSTTTEPSAWLGISPADSHSARGARLIHARKTARLYKTFAFFFVERMSFFEIIFRCPIFNSKRAACSELPQKEDPRPRMPTLRKFAAGLALLIAFTVTTALPAQVQEDRPAAPAQAGLLKKLGTVKSTSENTITLKSDSGPDFTAAVQDTTRIFRIPPGQTDLKNAQPIKLQDVQVGDRMLVRGKAGDVPDSIIALQIVVMTKSDVAQKQQQDLQDWQKRGVGGIVSAIDASSGSLTLAGHPCPT